jgi:hypothetical protein
MGDIHDHVKVKWTPREDDQLRIAVSRYGTASWARVAVCVPTRTGKQCRERWIGQLAPTVTKETLLVGEDEKLMRVHAMLGNQWTAIARHLPGRSPLCIKNRCHWLTRHGPRGGDANGKPDCGKAGALPAAESGEDGLFGTLFQEFRVRMLTGLE